MFHYYHKTIYYCFLCLKNLTSVFIMTYNIGFTTFIVNTVARIFIFMLIAVLFCFKHRVLFLSTYNIVTLTYFVSKY